MRNEELYYTITSLIKTKREDDYWDFKREHHKCKADLLHDILCMANSLHDKDCYIILGVDEESGDIVGVENNEVRRNQQGIIDFLRSKKFAGDHRPKIELQTIEVRKHEVDVIVVLNTLDTPYYLTEDHADSNGKSRTVRANAIYTRVGDTNTPIDKAADYSHVEYLWKKRLGLHLSPFERLCWLLRDKSQWEKGEIIQYNKLYPEFTLSFEDLERGNKEFYSYMMTNESTSYGMVNANYYGTTLDSYQTVYLDSGRFSTVVPQWGFVPLDQYHHNNLSYKYYIEDSLNHILHLYLWNEESHEACYARDEFLEVVLVFHSTREKEMFVEYIESDVDSVASEIESIRDDKARHVRGENEPALSALAKEIATGIILNRRLTEFRTIQEDPIHG